MFDFRYHALSLVAVFLALGIGIVLGSSLGDTVVSQANRDVRSSLRGDLLDARADARSAHAAVSNRDRFIAASFARLAGGSLRGERVAVIASGDLPQSIESNVRMAVKQGGGTVDSVSKFNAKPDLPTLGRKLRGRFLAYAKHGGPRPALTKRLARALVSGGPVGRKLEAAFSSSFSGDFKGAGAVVFYRANGDRDAQAQRFETALINGLRSTRVPVVGVEASDTDPSQIPTYVRAGLSTVDSVDQPAGAIALALALAGSHGNFGFKSTADSVLPPKPPGGARR